MNGSIVMRLNTTKGEPRRDESEIGIPGAERAGITALADRRRHLPRSGLAKVRSCQGTVLPATHFCVNIELYKAVIRWMSDEQEWK